MSATAAPAKKTALKTTYHVLEQTKAAQTGANAASNTAPAQPHAEFKLVGRDITANSAEHAIRIHAEKAGEEAVYVAVPSRSWRPVKLTVATKKTITLTEAT